MDVRPIRTLEDHDWAVREVILLGAPMRGTPEHDRLHVLQALLTQWRVANFPPVSVENAVKLLYGAYGDFVDWKNYQGLPMPTWEALPEKIRGAWGAATKKGIELSMSIICSKCKKTTAQVNDGESSLGEPVCCGCWEP
jgi:hypothetical protein